MGIPIPRPPTWRNFVESLAAGVRELPPGDRPKDWVDRSGAAREVECGESTTSSGLAHAALGSARGLGGEAEAGLERYKISFTASQEYVDLLERAQDLLSHAVPERTLEEVHLRALRLLVAGLEKRRYGAPRRKSSTEGSASDPAASDAPPAAPTTSRATRTAVRSTQSQPPSAAVAPAPRQRPRSTRRRGSAAVRRAVWDRDQGRCTYVDECGNRCRETRLLQLHHLHAHARGGGETALNLTLRCAAHNALAAEDDFGREFMLQRSRRRQR